MPRWSMRQPLCMPVVALQPCRQRRLKLSGHWTPAPRPRFWSGCGASPRELVLASKAWPEPMKLDEILEHKRVEIAERERCRSLDEVMRSAEAAPTPRELQLKGEVALIAEVK